MEVVGLDNRIALDIESADLTARYDPSTEIWCLGFGFWIEDDDGDVTQHRVCLPFEQGREVLNAYIESGQYIFGFHNSAFDVAALRLHGCDIPPGMYEDTMLRAYLLQPASRQMHSLGAWGERLGQPKLDYRAKLIEAGLLKEDAPAAAEYAVPYNSVMAEYNLGDIATTQELWDYTDYHFYEDPRVEWCYYNVELPYVEVIMEMEQGAYVSIEKLHELGDILKPRIQAALDTMKGLAHHMPEVQWNQKTKKFTVKEVTYKQEMRLNGNMVKGPDNIWTFKEGGKLETTSYKRGVTPLGNAVSAKARVENVHNLHYTYTFAHCDVDAINPNSDAQVAWYLMNYCKWKPTQFTKTKQPSVKAEVLVDEEGEFIDAYKEYALLQKLYGTFVEGLLSARQENGYVYGSYQQCTTVTCRLSSNEPNLQNIPTRSDLGKVIRQAFVAPPGHVMAIADLDRIEIVVLSFYLEHLFGDSRMSDASRNKVDHHDANANAWFAEDVKEDADKARRKAKDTIFAVNYGIMAKSLAKRIHVSEAEAQGILDMVADKMPAIMEAKEWVWDTCKKRRPFKWVDIWDGSPARHGFMYDIVGHRLYYPNITSDNEFERGRAERQAFNALIQGGAGGIMKILHTNVWRYLRQKGYGRCFLAVHDENGVYLQIDAIQGQEEVVLRELTECFCSNTLLVTEKGPIPVTGEFQFGRDWKECKTTIKPEEKGQWLENFKRTVMNSSWSKSA